MATVAQPADFSKRPFLPTKHYAHLDAVEGIATLVPGGYVFRADSDGYPQLVSYKDTRLVLHGYVEDEPPADPRPLWQQIADPGYYNGSASRGTLVRGGRA